jgi:sugar phosphate isomerase/epimerase
MSWRIGISSGACVDAPILDIIHDLCGSGARGIEVGTPPRHFDPLQEDQTRVLAARLEADQLQAVSIHAPFGAALDLADPNPHHRHAAVGAALTSGDAIRRLNGSLVVVHPSDLVRQRHHDVSARLTDCLASLRALAHHFRSSGVTLAVESPLPHLIGGHPDEFAWLLEHLDPDVKVCLDTGHLALGRHWDQFVDIAGKRLTHVHANDNHGHRDDHLPPGDGQIDWAAIAASLHAASFNGWIMLELRCPTSDRPAYFKRAYEQALRLLPVAPPVSVSAARGHSS